MMRVRRVGPRMNQGLIKKSRSESKNCSSDRAPLRDFAIWEYSDGNEKARQ